MYEGFLQKNMFMSLNWCCKRCKTRVRAIWTHCLWAIHFVEEFSSCNKTTIQLRSACLVLSRIKNVFAGFFEDSLRTCHVSRRVVMSKSSWTVGTLCCVFWHGLQVQFKSVQSFCTQKRVFCACYKRYQKALKDCINHSPDHCLQKLLGLPWDSIDEMEPEEVLRLSDSRQGPDIIPQPKCLDFEMPTAKWPHGSN